MAYRCRSRYCRDCAKRYPLGWANCPKCGCNTTTSTGVPEVDVSEARHLEFNRLYPDREADRRRIAEAVKERDPQDLIEQAEAEVVGFAKHLYGGESRAMAELERAFHAS